MATLTDQEINEAVARKLGWEKIAPQSIDPGGRVFETFKRDNNVRCIGSRYPLPAYSTSIEAAWECLSGKDFSVSYGTNAYTLKKEFTCFINIGPQRGLAESADTAPRAICKAFLKLDAEVAQL